MIESKHRAKLHELLRPSIYALGTTGVAANGVADAWYSGSKGDLWCEHKRFAKCPPMIHLTKADITTPLQQNWLKARHAEGRNVSMIIFTDDLGHLLLMGDAWQNPISRELLQRLAKTRRELAAQIIEVVGAIPGGPKA